MAINKVVYGNQTLIDLTDSTLTSSDELVEGVIAYDRSGNRLTGTADYMGKVDNPSADKILIDDGNGQAQDSSVSIIDVALMSDVNGKQDVLTAGDGISISSNGTISNVFTALSSNTDLDTITYNYQGYVSSGVNTPSGYVSGMLVCVAHQSGTNAMQIFHHYNSQKMFVRYYRASNNPAWSDWKPLIMTAGTGISIEDDGTIINRFANLTNVDLNTIRYNCQAYATDNCTNKPTSNGGMFICTMGSNNGTYGVQLFITYATTNQGVYYRRFNGSATPTEWVKLENEITSTSGTVTMNTSGLIASASVIKEGGWVYVQMNRTGTTQFTANTTQAVGTLPEGFRPSSSRNGMTLMTLSGIPTYWTVTSGGVLSLRVATVPATNTATYMTFYFPL